MMCGFLWNMMTTIMMYEYVVNRSVIAKENCTQKLTLVNIIFMSVVVLGSC